MCAVDGKLFRVKYNEHCKLKILCFPLAPPHFITIENPEWSSTYL